jgi:hypothetical protein
MKAPKRLPEISPAALRDHGDEERIERIWRRLESDLATAPARPRAALWWAPAAVFIVFGAGVIVGARWSKSEIGPATARVEAEPRGAGEEPASAPDERAAEPIEPAEQPEPLRQRRMLAPPPAPSPEIEAPPAPTSALVPSGPPEWHRLAQTGDLRAARAVLERQGGFEPALAGASPDQLMSLADIARDAGLAARAIQALRKVVQQFPGDPNAPIAALNLGQLLRKAGDREGAAQAFGLYRSLSPKGEFAEDALARQVEVAVEQGNLEQAQKLADQYGKDFPNGRRLAEIRAQIAKLSGEPAEGPGSEPPAGSEDESPSEEPDEASATP